MGRSPAFQFYPADYLSDENVALMTCEEEGVYIRALAHCWLQGSVPADPEMFSRLCKGCCNQTSRVVQKCFVPDPTDPARLRHKRLDAEREKQHEWSAKSSAGGQASAKSKKDKRLGGLTNAQPHVNGGSRVVEPNVNTSFSSSSSITTSTAEQKTTTRVVVPDEHEMPAWLPLEPWEAFVRMRKKSKEPFTQDAVKLAITKLGKMAESGQDVAEVLNQSTLNGWKGLFEIKGSATNGKFVNKSQQRSNSNIEAVANYIAESDGREAAADFVRGATGQSERYSIEDLRKPTLEAPDRGRAGGGHQAVTIEATGGGNCIPRPGHA